VSTKDGTRGWREWAADALIWAVLAAPVAANQLLDGAWFAGAAAVAATALAVATARRAPLVGWFVVVAGTFALVGAGLSNAEIARRLFLVEGTVKAYVSSLLSRLGVRHRVQTAILAYEAGLV
jgi:hypothetical protein